jgi:adhesin HecA-like repeat protein
MGNKIFSRIYLPVAMIAAAAALAAPAGAATVVNGDFETGNLSGWTQVNDPTGAEQSGEWTAYSSPSPFTPPLSPPPGGTYAATTFQEFVGTHILYQDVALEPYYSHQLSLLAYYWSSAPLVTPEPNTLSSGGEIGGPPTNQQYRIDVIRPTAPIDSVNPTDILATVFATKTGDPEELAPTTFTADLTPFAGQTVRLRFAEVDNEGGFLAATDSIGIASTPPSNAITLGKPVLNKKKGTAKLPTTVPGAGTLTIADVKKTKKRIKAKTIQVSAAGTVNLPVRPTKSARKTLANKGRLKIKVAITFTPTGGFAATVTRKLTLKLTPKR